MQTAHVMGLFLGMLRKALQGPARAPLRRHGAAPLSAAPRFAWRLDAAERKALREASEAAAGVGGF